MTKLMLSGALPENSSLGDLKEELTELTGCSGAGSLNKAGCTVPTSARGGKDSEINNYSVYQLVLAQREAEKE